MSDNHPIQGCQRHIYFLNLIGICGARRLKTQILIEGISSYGFQTTEVFSDEGGRGRKAARCGRAGPPSEQDGF